MLRRSSERDVRWLAAVGLLLVTACGSAARPSSTPRTTLPAASTTTIASEVSTGRPAGPTEGWQSIRVLAGGRTLAIAYDSTGLVFRGLTARMTPTQVIVTVFAAPLPGRVPDYPCCMPPGGTTKTLALPQPVGNRVVIDGAATPDTSQDVPWTRSTVSADGMTVSVAFPDRSCSRVSRASTVETASTVIITAVEPATTHTTAEGTCAYDGDGPLTQQVHLAGRLNARHVIDGACLVDPNDVACHTGTADRGESVA